MSTYTAHIQYAARIGQSGGKELREGSGVCERRKAGCTRKRRTHRRKKNANAHQMIVVDHIATANVCSLRFLGIFAGTNLRAYPRI